MHHRCGNGLNACATRAGLGDALRKGYIGRQIGAYTLGARSFGRGGMGRVLAGASARRRAYRRQAAIKLLRRDLALGGATCASRAKAASCWRGCSTRHRAAARRRGPPPASPTWCWSTSTGADRPRTARAQALARRRVRLFLQVPRAVAHAQPAGRAPRPEARQRDGRRRRAGQAAGLRHRQAAGPRAEDEPP